jgi:rhodanese-related sulfurtransferase
LVLLLLALGLAAGLREWRPAGMGWSGALPGPGEITWAQARELGRTRPILWADARPAAAFAIAHVPGAVNLNENQWEDGFGQLMLRWTPDKPVVVYCDDDACNASRAVAARLRDHAGLPEVYVLLGGWAEARAELEKESGKANP